MSVTAKWQCNQCDETHISKTAAEDCCPVSVSQIWECDDCGEEYDDEKDAQECCPELDENDEHYDAGKAYQRRQKALEQAGQIRLFQ